MYCGELRTLYYSFHDVKILCAISVQANWSLQRGGFPPSSVLVVTIQLVISHIVRDRFIVETEFEV